MEIMGALQLHPPLPLFKHTTTKSYKLSSKLSMSRGFHKLNALETNSPSGITDLEEELPSIDFAFVSVSTYETFFVQYKTFALSLRAYLFSLSVVTSLAKTAA